MGFVLVIGTVISYCGAIAIIGAIYKFWAPHPSCGLNIFFITFTLVLALIFTLISVSPWRLETAGLLTSGVVFLYCAWICWSALASEPDDARCTYQGSRGTTAEKVNTCAKHAPAMTCQVQAEKAELEKTTVGKVCMRCMTYCAVHNKLGCNNGGHVNRYC